MAEKNKLKTCHELDQTKFEIVVGNGQGADGRLRKTGVACRESRDSTTLLEATVSWSSTDNPGYEQDPVQ